MRGGSEGVVFTVKRRREKEKRVDYIYMRDGNGIVEEGKEEKLYTYILQKSKKEWYIILSLTQTQP